MQDTTEVDVTHPEVQVDGVGPLSSESRVGLYYHPLMGFDLPRAATGNRVEQNLGS